MDVIRCRGAAWPHSCFRDGEDSFKLKGAGEDSAGGGHLCRDGKFFRQMPACGDLRMGGGGGEGRLRRHALS